ncbi:MAG: formylglycine-generating enzyme family protein, partial [Phycisphaerae bacterium]|nr:formylglycine-generating enzyme family protein [Phycisphaerae bacterium]
TDGKDLRQVTKSEPDVDNYDACYLPDGQIVFASTACFQGVPCVGGGNQVANLYRMNADGEAVRQLCFDQDHDWCPTVANDGRVMFTRWEYSDTPHYFTRVLMHMNPDGTGQTALYGSNSFWPNSTFFARPIPGHPSRFVAVISGHHGAARMGELILFDPAVGTQEADVAIQRIPGYGKKVEPIIQDQLVNNS